MILDETTVNSAIWENHLNDLHRYNFYAEYILLKIYYITTTV
jgi:hypothetical protein